MLRLLYNILSLHSAISFSSIARYNDCNQKLKKIYNHNIGSEKRDKNILTAVREFKFQKPCRMLN